jgi:hypothetical protein
MNRVEVRRAVDGMYIIAVGKGQITISEQEALEVVAKVAQNGRPAEDGLPHRAQRG